MSRRIRSNRPSSPAAVNSAWMRAIQPFADTHRPRARPHAPSCVAPDVSARHIGTSPATLHQTHFSGAQGECARCCMDNFSARVFLTSNIHTATQQKYAASNAQTIRACGDSSVIWQSHSSSRLRSSLSPLVKLPWEVTRLLPLAPIPVNNRLQAFVHISLVRLCSQARRAYGKKPHLTTRSFANNRQGPDNESVAVLMRAEKACFCVPGSCPPLRLEYSVLQPLSASLTPPCCAGACASSACPGRCFYGSQ
jgi:hypothetical protein